MGVDEAGRGALAGPVVAAAAHIPAATYDRRSFRRDSRTINDSKQLKPEQRESQLILIEQWRLEGMVVAAPGVASVAEIEQLNILGATRLAMQRALDALELALLAADAAEEMELLSPTSDVAAHPRLLVDGKPLKPFPWRHTAVVGGDGKSLAIAMASIVAKVTRDRLMVELHAEETRYGFDQHKGYGAPRHLDALREHGASAHHRKLFLRKLETGPVQIDQTELF